MEQFKNQIEDSAADLFKNGKIGKEQYYEFIGLLNISIKNLKNKQNRLLE